MCPGCHSGRCKAINPYHLHLAVVKDTLGILGVGQLGR